MTKMIKSVISIDELMVLKDKGVNEIVFFSPVTPRFFTEIGEMPCLAKNEHITSDELLDMFIAQLEKSKPKK